MSVINVLAAHGISLQQAREFLISNQNSPKYIYDIANQYGLNFADLGSIVGFTPAQVQAYFSGANLGPTNSALARIGLTANEARSIVNSAFEAGSYTEIFNSVKALGFNITDLVSISQSWTQSQIEKMLTSAGLNPEEIGGNPASGGDDLGDEYPFITELYSPLALHVITFNNNSGQLSTETIRESVLAKGVSIEAYNTFFNPTEYFGSEDGTFTPSELGFSHLGSFAATSANLESIYYGTMIKTFKSIDMAEVNELGRFATANEAKLSAGDSATLKSYVSLLIAMFEDPANPPLLSDEYLAATITTSTAEAAQIVGSNGTAFFDPASLLSAFG